MTLKHKDFQDWLSEVIRIVSTFSMGQMYADINWYDRFCQQITERPVDGPIARYAKKGYTPFDEGVLTSDNPVVQRLKAIADEINTLPGELRVRQLVRDAYELIYEGRGVIHILNPEFLRGTTSSRKEEEHGEAGC